MDGFESAEPSPSYSPQASPEPAEGDGPAEATEQLTAAQGPPVHEAIPAPAPAAPAPALASQLAGGCSSGEAEAMTAPATPTPALPACCVAALADAPPASAPDAEDEAWKCTTCACEHEGAEARFLSCKLCYTARDDDEDVAPLSQRALATAQPASTSSKHKLPAASAADRPSAKKLRQSSGGAPAGKKAEEAEEQRYDESDGQLYPYPYPYP